LPVSALVIVDLDQINPNYFKSKFIDVLPLIDIKGLVSLMIEDA